MKKVIYTGNIPQCPYCEKPTKRSGGQIPITTLAYRPIVYNESGNIIMDKMDITEKWHCHTCDKIYTVEGNDNKGYHYID